MAMLLALGVALLGLPGCKSRGSGPVRTFVEEPFPEKLSEWNLFRGDGSTLEPTTSTGTIRTTRAPRTSSRGWCARATSRARPNQLRLPGTPSGMIRAPVRSSSAPAPRTLIHEEGVALVREWIQQLAGDCEMVGSGPVAK
jgi:hypothetical protein